MESEHFQYQNDISRKLNLQSYSHKKLEIVDPAIKRPVHKFNPTTHFNQKPEFITVDINNIGIIKNMFSFM